MTRDEIKKSGLLDQYVLGLTSPEQTRLVEQLIQDDPFLGEEVERLRASLFLYADSQDIAPPPRGERKHRSMEDFHSLDHEMILEMTERNHSLNIWRFVLGGVCLLLLCLSGYLFRIKENYRAELISEQAQHAQDQDAFRRHSGEEAPVDWSAFNIFTQPTDLGPVRVCLNPAADHFLLDLSHLAPPNDGQEYFISLDQAAPRHIPVDRLGDLLPLPRREHPASLRLFASTPDLLTAPEAQQRVAPVAVLVFDTALSKGPAPASAPATTSTTLPATK